MASERRGTVFLSKATASVSASATRRRRSSVASMSTATRRRRASVTEEVGKEVNKNLPLTRAHPAAGIIDHIKKTPPEKPEKELKKVSILALLRYSNTKERWIMFIGIIFAGLSGLGLPAWLILLAQSLDKFNNIATAINAIGGEGLEAALQRELLNLVIAFVIVGCIALVAGAIYVSAWTYTGEQQALRIKEKFVRSALKQDAEWFDTNDREELPTKIANAMVHISGAVGRQIADVFANACTAAGCLIVAFILNTYLALVMLAIVPFVALAVAIISCFIRQSSRDSAKQFSKAGAIATEVISGIKTVASLCAQPWAILKYETHVREGQRKAIYAGFLSGLAAGVMRFLFYCSYTVAFIIGTEQVARDSDLLTVIKCFFSNDPQCRVTGASVMCCIYGVILCATFFGLMAPGLNAINLGRQAAADIFETINRVPKIDPTSEEGIKPDSLQGELELRDVVFSYPSRPHIPIFYNFNLHIKPGQSMALCGPSGSGKSTIARLLLRFYDPGQGDVLVDGHPLTGLNLRWWRSQVGYVAQQPTLFPGTIKNNIAVGKEGATDEEVFAAAKAACAHEFIMDFPEGYDTYYSGASIQLSGGQMQRISIARAIIRNPSVLLLDEATSALDSNSERQVQDALANIRKIKQTTTVTVAHRLSTIIDSDQIAVISNGSIAELGTHKSLFQQNGIYTSLCELQGITADSQVGTAEPRHDDETPDSAKMASDDADIEKGDAAEQADAKDVEDLDEPEEEPLAPMSRLWEYNKPEWAYLLMGVIGAGAVGALSPCEAILTAQIVANYYTVEGDAMRQANLKWELGFLALAGAALAGNIMLGCAFSVCGYRLTRRMRVMTFKSIVRRNIGWFDFPEHSTGELTTRLEADAETCAKVTGWQLGYRIQVFSSLTAGVVISLVFTWQIGLIAIACIPLIMGAAVIQAICLSKRFVKEQEGLSPATILEQGLRGITAVQAYDLEGKVADDYATALEPESQGNVKLGFVSGAVYGFSQFAIFVSFAIIFYVGSLLLVNEGLLFVNFFTSVLSVMFGAIGVGQVNADFKAQQDGRAAAARIFSIVDQPLDDMDPLSETGEKPAALNGSVAFESCYFSYPSRPNKLIYYKSDKNDGFSLSIEQEQSVAFTGPSGCGKSTALQLALRFYEVSHGAVSIDGHKVEDLNIQWLRDQIGYVGQQPVLFSGTVKDNILLGKPDASDDEIVKAAQAANAHEFIKNLEFGYNTDIGTGGSLLSGGQQQRVAIARAVVKNPKLLVLDEATSALDNESEKVVQAALDDMQRTNPRTTLVVAHRLVTVKGCDKIAVLGDGGVNELGSHDELLKQKGLYYELWMKQGAREEEEDELKEKEEKA